MLAIVNGEVLAAKVIVLGAISKYISDVSVLCRLLFTAAYLPSDLPDLGE